MIRRLHHIFSQIGFVDARCQEAFLHLLALSTGHVFHLHDEAAKIEEIDRLMQLRFLREPGTERCQNTKHVLDAQRKALIPLLSTLGFYGATLPKRSRYDAVLILGADQRSFEARMAYAAGFLSHGVVCDRLFLLGGQRDLWPLHEAVTAQLIAEQIDIPLERVQRIFRSVLTLDVLAANDPHLIPRKRLELMEIFRRRYPELVWPTETSMMLHAPFSVPRGIDMVLVDAPKKADGRRPDTLDTVLAWKEGIANSPLSLPHACILAVSSQPHALYQQNVLHRKIAWVETVAPGVDPEEVPLAVVLDSLARAVHVGKTSLEKTTRTIRRSSGLPISA